MTYQFRVDDAIEHGVEQATLLHNLRFWCQKNAANNMHMHECSDGMIRAWTYNSAEALTALFPFWNRRKIARLLSNLAEKGVIEKKKLNENPYDQTLWYTVIDHQEMRVILDTSDQSSLDTSHQCTLDTSDQSSFVTDNKPDKKLAPTGADTTEDSLAASFQKVWDIYPRKEGKTQAFNNWKKLIKRYAAEDIFAAAQNYRDAVSKAGTEKRFVIRGGNFFSPQQGRYEDYLPGAYQPEEETDPKIEAAMEILRRQVGGDHVTR